jgi:hypothetical protein
MSIDNYRNSWLYNSLTSFIMHTVHRRDADTEGGVAANVLTKPTKAGGLQVWRGGGGGGWLRAPRSEKKQHVTKCYTGMDSCG